MKQGQRHCSKCGEPLGVFRYHRTTAQCVAARQAAGRGFDGLAWAASVALRNRWGYVSAWAWTDALGTVCWECEGA